MKRIAFTSLIIGLIYLGACTKDNIEDLNKAKLANNTPNSTTPQDTTATTTTTPGNNTVNQPTCDTANISYSAKIVPIIEQKCGSKNSSCHTSQAKNGGVALSTHHEVVQATNGQLMKAIKWEGNASRMPFNSSKLDDCSILFIQTWINQGKKDN